MKWWCWACASRWDDKPPLAKAEAEKWLCKWHFDAVYRPWPPGLQAGSSTSPPVPQESALALVYESEKAPTPCAKAPTPYASPFMVEAADTTICSWDSMLVGDNAPVRPQVVMPAAPAVAMLDVAVAATPQMVDAEIDVQGASLAGAGAAWPQEWGANTVKEWPSDCA